MFATSALKLLRRKAGVFFVESAFRSFARIGRLHPRADPERHGVDVLRDIAYRPTGRRAHLLDVYLPPPAYRGGPEPLPVVFYVHGGGFRILSKETHWMMGLRFARRGY